MARISNSDTREAAYVDTAGGTKFHGEQRSANVLVLTKKNRLRGAGPGDYKQIFNRAQHQIEILVERNIGLQKDLAELAQKESQARQLAYHDGLTGLPNRNLLQDRFRQALSLAERRHKPLALLMLDLDGFKSVNDTLGHGSGDKLLQAVAARLIKGIRGADTACRYGGDEFVIMLPEIDGLNTATALVDEISGRLSESYTIDEHTIHMAVSIGVAVYPRDALTLDGLLKVADVAMYLSKGTGPRTFITGLPGQGAGKAEAHDLSAPRSGRPSAG